MTPNLTTSRHRDLVLRANELFHDLEGRAYDEQHPEILVREQHRWETMLDVHLPQGKPLRCLDIGAGTGFVGMLLLPRLAGGSCLICTDISREMLRVCEQRLQAMRNGVSIEMVKVNDESLPLPSASVDVVTMNSLLHHVPSPSLLLTEIVRVMRPGGRLFIGHEPNRRFFHHAFLLAQSTIMHALHPKRVAAHVLRLLGIYNRVIPTHSDPLLAQINLRLKEEGLIERELSRADLSALIDVHSPTAGGLRPQEGFDPYTLLTPWHDTVHVREIRTYNYLGKESGKRLLQPYEALLRRILPGHGATFFLTAERHGEGLPHTRTSSRSPGSAAAGGDSRVRRAS